MRPFWNLFRRSRMSIHQNPSESNLVSLLNAQGDQYQTAIGLVEEIQSSSHVNSASAQGALAKLKLTLQKLTELDTQVQSARHEHESSGLPKSDALNQTINEQAEQLRSFIARVDAVHSDLVMIRSRMTPQLDEEVRRSSMQKAYGRSLRSR